MRWRALRDAVLAATLLGMAVAPASPGTHGSGDNDGGLELIGAVLNAATSSAQYGYISTLNGIPGIFGSAQQNEFDDYLLDAIAAVVVGGTSLFGGRGGIPNTIIGLFVLGVLNNGLDHVDIDSFLKILIRGLILLIALIINVYAQRLRSTRQAASAQEPARRVAAS